MNIQMEELYRTRYVGERAIRLQCPPRTHNSSSTSTCSTWKLSKTRVTGILWRLPLLGMIDHSISRPFPLSGEGRRG